MSFIHNTIYFTMNKSIVSVFVSVVLLASCSETKNDKNVDPTVCPSGPSLSQQMIEAHGYGNFDCNMKFNANLATTGWDYVSGLVAFSIAKAYEAYPEHKEYLEAVKAFADFNTSLSGNEIYKGETKVNAIGNSCLDDLAAGKIFFALYDDAVSRADSAAAARYKNAATMLRNKLKYEHSRIPSGYPGVGGFYHKPQYAFQMWLDGLYMGPALYAMWQHHFGEELGAQDNFESWSDIALQFKTLHQYTYDSDKQLCYHAWSANPSLPNSFWARRDGEHKGCSPEFWGRGMGWYFAALLDVLELMPQSHPDYPVLLDNFRAVAAGLRRWQDKESGLWYQLLQYDSSVCGDGKGDLVNGQVFNVGTQANYLESSASCMYTYVFFKAVRLGLLDKTEYLPVAQKAFEGITSRFLTHDGGIGINSICASAGLGPQNDLSRTGTINYYLCGRDVTVTVNEGKSVGTFILASVEEELSRR